jgi:hypothetical protein
MKPWTMAEVRLLKEEIAKGKSRDLAALAARLGRSRQSLLSQANNQKMKALRMEPQARPGFRCDRCGASLMWDELPSDDPMALLGELKRWKQTHLMCKEGK